MLCECEIAEDQRWIEMSLAWHTSRSTATARPSPPYRGQIRDNVTGRFIANGEARLFLGAADVGKIHLPC